MKLKDAKFVVVDTETTGQDPPKDKVVEIGMQPISLNKKEAIWSTLVNPGISIPPESSAVHHIVDEDVRLEKMMVNHEETIVTIARDGIMAAHNASFDRSFLPMLKERPWICTFRCAKKIWPEFTGYSLQYLRYQLGLNIITKVPPHRVDSDVGYTTELLIRILEEYLTSFLVDGDDSLSKFLDWAASPTKLYKMPFGMHEGKTFDRIPTSYIHWALNNLKKIDGDLEYTLIGEINMRKMGRR